jgi:hypothetical protein
MGLSGGEGSRALPPAWLSWSSQQPGWCAALMKSAAYPVTPNALFVFASHESAA